MKNQSTEPIEVFYSYAHEDEELRNELEKHLSVLRRQGVISNWHDRKISAGREWEGEISEHLNGSRIILLLISAAFLASDYCYDREMERALERHEAGEALVIPVILRAVDWEGELFGKLQALPKDAKPVTSWANRDEAFKNVAQGIRAAIEDLLPRPDGEMVKIPAGEFLMGTDKSEIPGLVEWAKQYYPWGGPRFEDKTPQAGWFEVETPRHTVYLDDFYIDTCPVTNAQYRKFVQATGYPEPIGFLVVDGEWQYGFQPWRDDRFNAPDQPVVCVSWFEAMAYAQWARKRLPTEAEWEKAARGGLVSKRYPWGDEEPSGRCNFAAKGPGSTTPVKNYVPNGYGLYDMAGNVWEWCMDEYDENFYAHSPRENPLAGEHISFDELSLTDPRYIEK
ncbi:SUMF1/EgtB/PvdO family nonheme iron enzyme [Candidatus Poribacteria bacterium]|nr:SUMF1/EgtB/PvdO family nonheme iron enzyme [Candidatus Poribacteria bacterium]